MAGTYLVRGAKIRGLGKWGYFCKKNKMTFYQKLFLGFYCLTKKYISKENYPESYAVAGMAGSASFLYFSVTYFFMRHGASTLETIGLFLILYAMHHFLFVKDDKHKEMEKEMECSGQLIYRSVLYFVTTLALLMFVTGILND